MSDVHCLLLDEPAVETTEIEPCVSDSRAESNNEPAEATESPLSSQKDATGCSKRRFFTDKEVLEMLSDSDS